MKILILVSSLAKTGPGFVVENFVNIASQDKYDSIDIIIVSLKKTDEGNNITIPDELKVFSIGDGSQSLKTSAKLLNDIIRDQKIDIVFSHGLKPDVISGIAGRNTTFLRVSTSHNNPFEDYTMLYGLTKGFAMAILQIIAFRRMDKVVTLNPYLDKIHRMWIGNKKTVLIPNGIQPVFESSGTLVERKRPVFGIVGVYNKRKNQDVILDVFNNENNSDGELVVWGSKFEHWQPKKHFSSVKLMGFSGSKTEVFSSFDILISMSKSEGLPLNVLEAISAGKALILSDIPAHRYISSFIPSTYVKVVSNEFELNQAVQGFLNDNKWRKNVQKMMQRVYDRSFSAQIMFEKYMEVFMQLLEGQSQKYH